MLFYGGHNDKTNNIKLNIIGIEYILITNLMH